MEQFIKDQIKYGLKYVPVNLIKSYFIPQSSAETEKLREKDFICGICHPYGDVQLLKDANIKWVRMDIPFPFQKDGSVSESFAAFKEKCASYAKEGIKVMAISPYPQDYTKNGIDLDTPAGEKRIREIAVYIINELKGVIGAIQVTNEMGIPRFTIPFTMKQAARFIAVQLEAMYPVRGDILIGYNSAGPQADLHYMLKPSHRYCDYVGMDIYIGCFDYYGGPLWFYDAMLRYLWAFTGKPVILQEFGYISGGAPKTKAQKLELIKKYGASSVKDAKNNIEAFVEKMPKQLGDHIKFLSRGDTGRYFNIIFKSELTNHVFCELPRITKIPGMPHTPEGQAKFYEKILPRIYNLKFTAGELIYCFADTDHCYVCGQPDCPTETKWGIVDCDLNPKPSYYAVRDAFAKIIKK